MENPHIDRSNGGALVPADRTLDPLVDHAIVEHRVQFHAQFHLSLLELMPDTPLMGTPVGEQISQSLVNCVLWAVYATEPAPVVGLTLQGVGLEVHRLGFPGDGYRAVVHALLRAVRGFYPADWTAETSSAWIGYHSWLSEHWLIGDERGQKEDADLATAPQIAPATPSYGEIMVSMTQAEGGNRSPERP